MSAKNNTRRVVVYYRVSTRRQGRCGLGLEAVQSSVRNYLNGAEWELIGEFTEIESGKHDRRPKLARALEVCRLQKAQAEFERTFRCVRSSGGAATRFDAALVPDWRWRAAHRA